MFHTQNSSIKSIFGEILHQMPFGNCYGIGPVKYRNHLGLSLVLLPQTQKCLCGTQNGHLTLEEAAEPHTKAKASEAEKNYEGRKQLIY